MCEASTAPGWASRWSPNSIPAQPSTVGWHKYEDAWLSGFAIGSGSVEGAGKNLVQARFKRAGMRWKTKGFTDVLELRVARLNGTLDGSHRRAATRARRAA